LTKINESDLIKGAIESDFFIFTFQFVFDRDYLKQNSAGYSIRVFQHSAHNKFSTSIESLGELLDCNPVKIKIISSIVGGTDSGKEPE